MWKIYHFGKLFLIFFCSVFIYRHFKWVDFSCVKLKIFESMCSFLAYPLAFRFKWMNTSTTRRLYVCRFERVIQLKYIWITVYLFCLKKNIFLLGRQKSGSSYSVRIQSSFRFSLISVIKLYLKIYVFFKFCQETDW